MADHDDNNSTLTDLFCDEETKAFCFDHDDDFVDHDQSNGGEQEMISTNGGSEPMLINNLPCLSEDSIVWMVEREKEYLPRHDYVNRFKCGDLDFFLRKMALAWIFKACTYFSFGELCVYTAMTYFDRFVSVYELPLCSLGDKTWAVQLLAVACLSLAAKLEEVNVPYPVDLQVGEPEFLFEGKTIQRMEILVLTRLNWKIKAYTPWNYIDFYLTKMNGGEFPSRALMSRSIEVILNTIQGIDFLDFRSSEIAAAVALYVSGEIEASIDIDKALSRFIGVIKDRVMKCFGLIQDLESCSRVTTGTSSTTTGAAFGSVTNATNSSRLVYRSPIGVLDAARLSYKSDKRTVESCPSSSLTSPSPDTKRRKLDETSTLENGDRSSNHEQP